MRLLALGFFAPLTLALAFACSSDDKPGDEGGAGGSGGEADGSGGDPGDGGQGGASGGAPGSQGGQGGETSAAGGNDIGTGGDDDGSDVDSVTVADLWESEPGIRGRLEDVCVTFVSEASGRAYVQDPHFDPDDDVSGAFYVYLGEEDFGASRGDLISVTGTTSLFNDDALQLGFVEDVSVVENNASECQDDALIQSVTMSDIELGGDGEHLYRYMLVEVTDVTVDTVSANYFTTVGSSTRVVEFSGGLDFDYQTDDELTTIRGIVDYFNGYNQLAPRSEDDLVP